CRMPEDATLSAVYAVASNWIHRLFTAIVEVMWIEETERRLHFFGRSFSRKTNLSPDQTSSTAQTFISTIPLASPMSRTTFSFRSVATREDFFGHEIQSMPAGDNFAE